MDNLHLINGVIMPRVASSSGVNYYMYLINRGFDGPIEYNGATMVFVQTAAPTGWVKLTTFDDFALRIVSGTVGTGGTANFSSVFTSHVVTGSISTSTTFSTGATTLATTQIPSHQHSVNGVWTVPTLPIGPTVGPLSARAASPTNPTDPAGGGGSHAHNQPVASVVDTFTGSNLNMSIRYLDSILATYPV
jgi:hypothetical protein